MQKSSQKPVFILPFEALDRRSLPLVGGKGANLGELTRAGFPVPGGFCITTAAYFEAAQAAKLQPFLEQLSKKGPRASARNQPEDFKEPVAAIRQQLLNTPMAASLREAIVQAYESLGEVLEPVAVRSSATAEDLPEASFAGQQDTFLNIIGAETVVDAVRRCWASLWNDRAVVYRSRNGINQCEVSISVVVQRLVAAKVAGVLFTANPLTGKRRQAVIDANPGLGESVVSGATTPDQFIVNTPAGEIVDRRISERRLVITATADGQTQSSQQLNVEKRACLDDEQVKALAVLGSRVEEYYGAPQDIEWALDHDGQIWLLQSRPITTLFPLPENAPRDDDNLRVYMSATGDEGVNRPITPMGLQGYRILISGVSRRLWNLRLKSILAGPSAIAEAGLRFYYDITPIARNAAGRKIIEGYTPAFDAYTAAIWNVLKKDPRLAPVKTPFYRLAGMIIRPLIAAPIIPYTLLALFNPGRARRKIEWLFTQTLTIGQVQPEATVDQRLEAAIQLIFKGGGGLFITGLPEAAAGYLALELAKKMLGNLATEDEFQTVLRGLPDNPTTEMGLALWEMALKVKQDPDAVQAITALPAEKLAEAFLAAKLPEVLQKELTGFLQVYGNRAVAEIDLGLPRWSEDPAHLFGILANYLKLEERTKAPDAQFQKAIMEGEAVMGELENRAYGKSRIRGILVRWLLNRTRRLIGKRELWKTQLTAIFDQTRKLLIPIGEELVNQGRLAEARDIFMIDFPEIKAGLSGKDLRPLVRARQEIYQRELKRTRVPQILLSDGTEPLPAPVIYEVSNSNTLHGTPASPGTVRGRARVILDPMNARIEPGEILVAPSTDPGWTPLFLTAAGLVMERGGVIAHGSVVAREYGIPAVVGTSGATTRIQTGQMITVDGYNGLVVFNE
ncbi:MAG TPA: PEP/pyruvate-binding domain-containing protein [Bacillota bacterium]|nr:PEP/pyruvate-binding domain-containing protein [Bacillota bacterium]